MEPIWYSWSKIQPSCLPERSDLPDHLPKTIFLQEERISGSGDRVLEKGRLVRPQDIALLALAGCTSVKVSKQPVVSVISSGNELVEPSEKPGSVSDKKYQLLPADGTDRKGRCNWKYLGIAKDDEDATFDIISQAISESDVVLITGGVSMGDFDFVPSVLERAGVKLLFSRINIQPGKPTTFGIHQKALVFGLPGNPVSSFIQFELLVRPLVMQNDGLSMESGDH